ncbi:hypothetical protein M9458_036840, partial [Cirrhinus mrigala]
GLFKEFSEAPGAHGSHSYAALLASYETASALAPRLDPEMGMAMTYILSCAPPPNGLLQKSGTPGGPPFSLAFRALG